MNARAFRTIIIITYATLFAVSVAQAADPFFVGTIKIDVTVTENIDIPKETIQIRLRPGETQEEEIELVNNGDVDSPVSLELTIDPPDNGVTAEMDKSVVVPANDSKILTLIVRAANNAIPGKSDIEIGVFRKEG